MGDIDILAIDSDKKKILFIEVKYIAPHFSNVIHKAKSEKQWFERAEERFDFMKLYVKENYNGYSFEVLIVTSSATHLNSKNRYINNLTMNIMLCVS